MSRIAALNADERLGLSPRAFPWHHFIRRSGEAGQRWVKDFEANDGGRLTARVDRALGLLRRRHLDEGRAELDQSLERLEALQASAPRSVVHVLERWYHSAVAYDRYLDEDFEGAERHFEVAVRAIRQAIEELPCLVSVANHCYDFRLQRARIARNQGNWDLMGGHIEAGRAMLENRHPLCVLESGQAIFIESVDAFYRRIEPQDDQERTSLEEILDGARRRQLFEYTVLDNYALPGVVIPYRPTGMASRR